MKQPTTAQQIATMHAEVGDMWTYDCDHLIRID